MYIIKNAIKNLIRNKGRNLICVIIILLIIVTTAVSLIINTTTAGIIEDYRNRFGSEVTIKLDFEKLMAKGMDSSVKIEPISPETYEKIAESDTLKSYNLKKEIGVNGKNLKAVGENDQTSGSNIISKSGNVNSDFKMPILRLFSADDVTSFVEFKNGERKITDGRMFEKINECIVSKDFAELNNLKVGSDIELLINTNDGEKAASLKVSGIYTDLSDEYGGLPIKDPFMNTRNQIITSAETLSSDKFKETGVNILASYTLKNPDLLDKFKKEAEEAGVSDSYILSTDKESYYRVVGPVEGLTKITTAFMVIVLILGSAILILISLMAIRERKYEIGVLRAMGMKKTKIALQFLTEIILITGICLIIGSNIGALAAQPVADSLLENQIKIAQEQNSNDSKIGGMIFMSGEKKDTTPTISELKVSLSVKAILQISAIALILATLASLTSIIYITKYEPIKILSERN